MKLIEIIAICFFIIGILLGGSDSADMEWFIWSKIVAAGCLGGTVILINLTEKEKEV